MPDLKFRPVRHDHKPLLEKASKRRGFSQADEALEVEYGLAHEMLNLSPLIHHHDATCQSIRPAPEA